MNVISSVGNLSWSLILILLQNPNSEKEKELEKQARIEASLRERERMVQRFRSEQTKEIDREREQHKREEAVQHFKALMSDMVIESLALCHDARLNISYPYTMEISLL